MVSVNLTDEELALLDGRCSADVQRQVDAATGRLSMQAALAETPGHLAAFIADAVMEAKNSGRLKFAPCGLRTCPYCKRSGGYAVHSGRSRYHRKGTPNYDKPLTIPGVELAQRFVNFLGHATVGCCRECWEAAQPLLVSALDAVKAEIPEAITGKAPRFKRFDNAHCTACGWTGHEGQMRPRRTLMGDGRYPGGCPACPAENAPLGRTVIQTTKLGFTLVAAEGGE